MTTNGRSLIHEHRDSAFYEVPLDELRTLEDARIRVERVVAVKSAWVTQRVVDELRRALHDLKGYTLPRVAVD